MSEEMTAILKNTYTKDDFHRRLSWLKSYLESVLFTEGLAADLDENFLRQANLNPGDREVLETWIVKIMPFVTKDNLYSFLNKIEAEAEMIPIFFLFLPFAFNDTDDKEELGDMIRHELGRNVWLDISLNEELVAGCNYSWENILTSLSFRDKLPLHHKDIVGMLSSLTG